MITLHLGQIVRNRRTSEYLQVTHLSRHLLPDGREMRQVFFDNLHETGPAFPIHSEVHEWTGTPRYYGGALTGVKQLELADGALSQDAPE